METDKSIFIKSVDLAQKTIKYFGHLIHNATVHTETIDAINSNAISQFLNNNSSESLTYLALHYIKENTFAQFTEPFNNLEDFSFKIGIRSEISTALPLNQLIPRIHRLNIELWSDVNYGFLYHEFIHLEHLTMSLSDKASTQIEGFLRKNPQIKSLESRPNIENLTLCVFDVEDETIHDCTIYSDFDKDSVPRT